MQPTTPSRTPASNYQGLNFRRLHVPGHAQPRAVSIGPASSKPAVMSFAGDDDSVHIIGDRWSIAGRTRAKSPRDPNADYFALAFGNNRRSTTLCDGMGSSLHGGKFAEILGAVSAHESLTGNEDLSSMAEIAAEVFRDKRKALIGEWLCEIVMMAFDDSSYPTSQEFDYLVEKNLKLYLVKDSPHLAKILKIISAWKTQIAPHGTAFNYYTGRDNLHDLKSSLDKFCQGHDTKQDYFRIEAAATAVHSVVEKDVFSGLTFARDQALGDAGSAWFNLHNGAFKFMRKSRPHSLVQDMYDAGIFQSLAAGFGGSPQDIDRRAQHFMRSHPRTNIIRAVINSSSGVHFVDAGQKIQDTDWFALESGQVFVRVNYCDLPPNCGPIELLGRDWKEGMTAQEMLAATVSRVDRSIALKKALIKASKRNPTKKIGGIYLVPEHSFRSASYPAYWAVPGAHSDDLTVVVEIIQT